MRESLIWLLPTSAVFLGGAAALYKIPEPIVGREFKPTSNRSRSRKATRTKSQTPPTVVYRATDVPLAGLASIGTGVDGIGVSSGGSYISTAGSTALSSSYTRDGAFIPSSMRSPIRLNKPRFREGHLENIKEAGYEYATDVANFNIPTDYSGNVAGDGSCFFYSVEYGIKQRNPKSKWNAAAIRKELQKRLQNGGYTNVSVKNGRSQEQADENLEMIRNPNAWIENEEQMEIVANIVNYRIYIYHPNMTQEVGGKDGRDYVGILYNGNNHYMALRPIN
jgi:hypothetical protein